MVDGLCIKVSLYGVVQSLPAIPRPAPSPFRHFLSLPSPSHPSSLFIAVLLHGPIQKILGNSITPSSNPPRPLAEVAYEKPRTCFSPFLVLESHQAETRLKVSLNSKDVDFVFLLPRMTQMRRLAEFHLLTAVTDFTFILESRMLHYWAQLYVNITCQLPHLSSRKAPIFVASFIPERIFRDLDALIGRVL